MAYSAPLYMEVRWRLHGSDEAWSEPRRVNPVREVVVEELDRTKQYDFEARNVSACGAKSDWVPSTHTVPDVPPGNLTLADIKTEADNAAADALAANQELANIASDNILSQGEKPVVIRDTNVITTEQAGIDAQATAFGVTTQKTDYDTAVTALTTYLATLTTPVLWSNLTGDTTIVGTTFRSKFADVYTTRQALLNAIYAAAKAKADAAQVSADLAQSNLYIIDPNFIEGINHWAVDYFPGGWYGETGLVSPSPVISTYVVHAGSTTAPNTNHIATTALRNSGFGAVKQGHVISASALIRPSGGPDGSADVRISWRNASQAEISVDRGNQITNATGTGMSRVTAAAPAGAVYAHIEVGAYSHTVGYYAYTGCDWNYQPNSLDEVPNSATYLKSLARSQGLVENGDFEVGDASTFPPPGWQAGSIVVGGGVTSPGYDTSYQYSGSRALYFTANQYNGYESVRAYQVTPGDYYAIGGAVAGTGGCAVFALYFLNASNGVTGSISITSPASGFLYQTAVGKVPAGSVSAKLVLANFVTGSHVVEFDALFMARCSSYDTALAIAGSGTVLGNQLNAPNSLTLNYGAVRSATALTASSTGAVSVNAFTYYMGAAAVNYSAVSNAVTGLTQGSSYYIYTRDPGGTGGTKTWSATTNVNALLQTYDDIVVAGQVTIPTSGSSGGGGGGLCVCDDMLVDEGLRAGDAQPGDEFDCLDLPTSGMTKFRRALEAVERSVTECVRLTTHRGAILECSTSTPFDLPGGGVEWAPRMLGREVITDLGVEIVTSVDHIGKQSVSHIHLGGCSYAAGRDARHRIYSHNLQYKP